jgi:UPF0176 protein
LLAHEGINGTIAAPVPAMEQVLEWLQTDSRFDGMSLKFSASDTQPFLRMKGAVKAGNCHHGLSRYSACQSHRHLC